jgi:hypothetical protein
VGSSSGACTRPAAVIAAYMSALSNACVLLIEILR